MGLVTVRVQVTVLAMVMDLATVDRLPRLAHEPQQNRASALLGRNTFPQHSQAISASWRLDGAAQAWLQHTCSTRCGLKVFAQAGHFLGWRMRLSSQ